jgi:hypothetical protein
MGTEDIEVETGGLGLRLTPRFVLQVIVYVIVVVMAYSALDKRIAALEARFEEIREMRADIKVLLQRTAKP